MKKNDKENSTDDKITEIHTNLSSSTHTKQYKVYSTDIAKNQVKSVGILLYNLRLLLFTMLVIAQNTETTIKTYNIMFCNTSVTQKLQLKIDGSEFKSLKELQDFMYEDAKEYCAKVTEYKQHNCQEIKLNLKSKGYKKDFAEFFALVKSEDPSDWRTKYEYLASITTFYSNEQFIVRAMLLEIFAFFFYYNSIILKSNQQMTYMQTAKIFFNALFEDKTFVKAYELIEYSKICRPNKCLKIQKNIATKKFVLTDNKAYKKLLNNFFDYNISNYIEHFNKHGFFSGQKTTDVKIQKDEYEKDTITFFSDLTFQGFVKAYKRLSKYHEKNNGDEKEIHIVIQSFENNYFFDLLLDKFLCEKDIDNELEKLKDKYFDFNEKLYDEIKSVVAAFCNNISKENVQVYIDFRVIQQTLQDYENLFIKHSDKKQIVESCVMLANGFISAFFVHLVNILTYINQKSLVVTSLETDEQIINIPSPSYAANKTDKNNKKNFLRCMKMLNARFCNSISKIKDELKKIKKQGNNRTKITDTDIQNEQINTIALSKKRNKKKKKTGLSTGVDDTDENQNQIQDRQTTKNNDFDRILTHEDDCNITDASETELIQVNTDNNEPSTHIPITDQFSSEKATEQKIEAEDILPNKTIVQQNQNNERIEQNNTKDDNKQGQGVNVKTSHINYNHIENSNVAKLADTPFKDQNTPYTSQNPNNVPLIDIKQIELIIIDDNGMKTDYVLSLHYDNYLIPYYKNLNNIKHNQVENEQVHFQFYLSFGSITVYKTSYTVINPNKNNNDHAKMTCVVDYDSLNIPEKVWFICKIDGMRTPMLIHPWFTVVLENTAN
ncbi:hypothetical protein BDAP_000008 [Binucleata daphniae]